MKSFSFHSFLFIVLKENTQSSTNLRHQQLVTIRMSPFLLPVCFITNIFISASQNVFVQPAVCQDIVSHNGKLFIQVSSRCYVPQGTFHKRGKCFQGHFVQSKTASMANHEACYGKIRNDSKMNHRETATTVVNQWPQ